MNHLASGHPHVFLAPKIVLFKLKDRPHSISYIPGLLEEDDLLLVEASRNQPWTESQSRLAIRMVF